jgi:hypothetical protein
MESITALKREIESFQKEQLNYLIFLDELICDKQRACVTCEEDYRRVISCGERFKKVEKIHERIVELEHKLVFNELCVTDTPDLYKKLPYVIRIKDIID